MTAVSFLALPEERQLALVFDTGTWRATRWADEHLVLIYHLPNGLLAEVTHDRQARRAVLLGIYDAARAHRPAGSTGAEQPLVDAHPGPY